MMDVRDMTLGSTAFVQLWLTLGVRDKVAWDEFCRRFEAWIYGVAMATLHNDDLAQDATQETLMRIVEALGSFDRSKGEFRTWLRTVVRNRAWDTLRKYQKGRTTPGGSQGVDDVADPHQEAELDRVFEEWTAKELLERLRAEYADNAERTQAIDIFCRLLQGASPKQVAKDLDVKQSAVYQAKYWVLERLREMQRTFDEDGPAPPGG